MSDQDNDNPPEVNWCRKLASFRIDFVKSGGPDHAFACEGHLGQMLVPLLRVSRGSAARVSGLPGSSDEPCELGVE